MGCLGCVDAGRRGSPAEWRRWLQVGW